MNFSIRDEFSELNAKKKKKKKEKEKKKKKKEGKKNVIVKSFSKFEKIIGWCHSLLTGSEITVFSTDGIRQDVGSEWKKRLLPSEVA